MKAFCRVAETVLLIAQAALSIATIVIILRNWNADSDSPAPLDNVQ